MQVTKGFGFVEFVAEIKIELTEEGAVLEEESLKIIAAHNSQLDRKLNFRELAALKISVLEEQEWLFKDECEAFTKSEMDDREQEKAIERYESQREYEAERFENSF
jgi:hypothetical protein